MSVKALFWIAQFRDRFGGRATEMISREQMLEATKDPLIIGLKTTAFSAKDVVNLILQRSEIIGDQPRPGRVVKAWETGDMAPALQLVEKMGDELIRRAAGIILREYREIKSMIDAVLPGRVADIGCGYAMFDLFLWQDHRSELLLIDLEQSDERHFGYRETGAAYSNLDVAKAFLTDNGVDAEHVTCLNPERQDILAEAPVDLAVSFISCGFHYPVDTYMPFFDRNVAAGGKVILDFRARKAREGREKLSAMGAVATLTDSANGNAKRVVLNKR